MRSHLIPKPTEMGRATVYRLVILVTLCAATGCQAVAYVAYVFFPKKTKARHQLADTTTAVLVDDPSHLLGDRTLSVHMANHVGFHLTQQGILSQAHLVPPGHIYELAGRLGDQFARTPVDQVGRQLKASQVIHVYVTSVSHDQEPGLIRPTATLQVKVIDAVEGKRLFPPTGPDHTFSGTSHPHGTVVATMRHRPVDNESPLAVRQVRKLLTERAGLEVARVFFDHLPRQPGDLLED